MKHISVNAGFYFKKAPKEYPGITRENWNFGKEKPITFSTMAITILVSLLDFFLKTGALERGNEEEELGKLKEFVDKLEVIDDAVPQVDLRKEKVI